MARTLIDGFAVLCYDTGNIGDEIQSIAASQYLPSVDYYVLRDNMSVVYDSKTGELIPPQQLQTMKIAVLVNGWFLHPGSDGVFHFPPVNCPWMIPFYTSLHISLFHKNTPMLKPPAIAYLKQYEPIGCRDTHTYNHLKKLGVSVYLSGCLTLGLSLPARLRNKTTIYSVRKVPKGVTAVMSHKTALTDVRARFAQARTTLNKYMTAAGVVTDRLHCYLPCVALGIPVKYVGTDDVRTHDYLVKPKIKFHNNNVDVRARIRKFTERFEVKK